MVGTVIALVIVCCLLKNAIATHESNGLDIIISLVLNDIKSLAKRRMDLALEIKVCHLRYTLLSTVMLLYVELEVSFCEHYINIVEQC